MCARFNENTVAYADSFYFIPSVLRKSITQNGDSWKSKVKQFMNSKAGDMHDTSTLDAEIELWENKWMNVPDTIEKEFSSVQNLLDIVEPSIYPNIYRVLELLAVFPPTTCTCERSISIIRRLKTPLRATMTQSRFNDLALMMVHRDLELDLNELINRMAVDYPKRLRMLYVLADNE